MKTKILLIILIGIGIQSEAQTNRNIGLGYFGQTVTHPGIVLEVEWEKMYTAEVAIPLRVDLGFFVHPRNHFGLFLDVNYGFRQYFKSGWFLEESIGVGALVSILNSDGAYEVDENGNVKESGNFSTVDFMPSITLGIGYNITHKNGTVNLLWLRPKVYWQLPHKTTSTFSPVLQIGYTRKL